MIDAFLCHGVHAFGTLQDDVCVMVFDGKLTDILALAVLVEAVVILAQRLMIAGRS
jgi:hypothetical protein